MSSGDDLKAKRAAAGERPPGARFVVTQASTIRAERTTWLWDGWVPLGHVSLLVGVPGCGKTTFAMQWAAELTRGELGGALYGEPARVLVISYEDSKSKTLVPRLTAAGADLDRVGFGHCADTGWVTDLTSQIPEIERAIAKTGTKFLFIDPLVAGLPGGSVDSHKDQSVRSALAPLVTMAEKHDLAIAGTMHLSKGATSALLGAGGSIGFVGLARSILIFGDDPTATQGNLGLARVVAHSKCNVGRKQQSRQVFIDPRSFVLEDGTVIETSRTILGDGSDVMPDDLVQAPDNKTRPRTVAAEFLAGLLADGPIRAREILGFAEAEGISKNTLYRAKEDLDVDSFQRDREWWWLLRQPEPEEPEAEEEPEASEEEE